MKPKHFEVALFVSGLILCASGCKTIKSEISVRVYNETSATIRVCGPIMGYWSAFYLSPGENGSVADYDVSSINVEIWEFDGSNWYLAESRTFSSSADWHYN